MHAGDRLRPALPDSFDGEREKGRAFINSCNLYMSLAPDAFSDEQTRINWALSYMKGATLLVSPPACSAIPFPMAGRPISCRTRNSALSSLRSSAPGTKNAPYFHPAPVAAAPAAPTAPVSCSIPLGVLMDIDLSCQRSRTPIICRRCKKPGHIACNCPDQFDIRSMTTDERVDWVMSLLADLDAVRAAMSVEAPAEAPAAAEEERSEGPEEGF
ncbi:hypothetical protein LshimejAT787_0102640 [Lyophyllum shimeji]|uniref:CCHC-type domain-containing protein n=1 Tax=Lyophyllum shimeji TaxID=47721 RepID=A0A9P3PCC0_LYOSH|nr:hypothetical protein LshimejAT787_0102640 [Lyophyllum shimeji]